MSTFHPDVSDEDFLAAARKIAADNAAKRQTCTHGDYRGMTIHGRCCPDCGEFMVDFGD